MDKRQSSAPCIRILANKIDLHVNADAVNSVLNTVANLDQHIHNDLNAVGRDLDETRREKVRLSKDLQHQREINASHHCETDLKNRLIDDLTL